MFKRVSAKITTTVLLAVATMHATVVLADSEMHLGKVATQIMTSFLGIAKLITAMSYIAGFGFAVGAVLKFKAHKDNPTQIPVGTPIALVFISAALLFLPSLMSVAGFTLFEEGGTAGGISGIHVLPSGWGRDAGGA